MASIYVFPRRNSYGCPFVRHRGGKTDFMNAITNRLRNANQEWPLISWNEMLFPRPGCKEQKQMTKWQEKIKLEGFIPDQINVSIRDGKIQVLAKSEHGNDNNKDIRESRRAVNIPDTVDVNKIRCFMYYNGTLLVEAPLKTGERERNDIDPGESTKGSTFKNKGVNSLKKTVLIPVRKQIDKFEKDNSEQGTENQNENHNKPLETEFEETNFRRFKSLEIPNYISTESEYLESGSYGDDIPKDSIGDTAQRDAAQENGHEKDSGLIMYTNQTENRSIENLEKKIARTDSNDSDFEYIIQELCNDTKNEMSIAESGSDKTDNSDTEVEKIINCEERMGMDKNTSDESKEEDGNKHISIAEYIVETQIDEDGRNHWPITGNVVETSADEYCDKHTAPQSDFIITKTTTGESEKLESTANFHFNDNETLEARVKNSDSTENKPEDNAISSLEEDNDGLGDIFENIKFTLNAKDCDIPSICVRQTDDKLTVTALRRRDENGRKMKDDLMKEISLPHGVILDSIRASLNEDGLLSITAQVRKSKEVEVPVQQILQDTFV